MIVNFTNTSPLYGAFRANEEQIMETIKLAATKSASSMGLDFNKVYYRSCQKLLEKQQKAA
jgi:hypothetical protein